MSGKYSTTPLTEWVKRLDRGKHNARWIEAWPESTNGVEHTALRRQSKVAARPQHRRHAAPRVDLYVEGLYGREYGAVWADPTRRIELTLELPGR